MNAPMLFIDLAAPLGPEVVIGSITRRGQWVEFYGLLALTRSDPDRADEYLSPERLHAMAQWSHGKKLESVGKEVARHCKELEQRGLGGVVEYQYRTRFWRLAIPCEQLRLSPSRAALGRWLESQTLAPSTHEWIDELEALVRAQLAICTGEGAKACDALREFQRYSLPEFEAWAALIDARGTDQHVDSADNSLALDELGEQWADRSDIAGRSVAARILARTALRKRDSVADQHAGLGRLAAELEQRGDLGALASVTNILGVLATRLGRPEEATRRHLRAAALFGIVGDPNSLQGALFNLANSYVKELQQAQRKPDLRALRLLDLGSDFARGFTVGRDAVQAETSGCHWCIEMGEYARARGYLEAAEQLVMNIDSAFEQGCFLLARARLEIVAPTGVHNAHRDLRIARRAFDSAGAAGARAEAEALIAQLENDRTTGET